MFLALAASALAGTVTFDLDGALVKGTALTVAPVGGAPVVGIDAVGWRFDGVTELLAGASHRLGGKIVGSITLKAADSTKIVGDALAGDPVAGWAELPEGTDQCRLEGSHFVFGTTSYLTTRQGGFVFGTTSYLTTRADFVYGQTAYFRAEKGDDVLVIGEVAALGSAGEIAVSGGADQCAVGVWDAAGLVYSTEVPCGAIGTYTADEPAPPVQIASLTADAKGALLPQLVWSWEIGGADPSDGVAWVR